MSPQRHEPPAGDANQRARHGPALGGRPLARWLAQTEPDLGWASLWWLPLVLLLGWIAHIGCTNVGWFSDDYMQQAMLHGAFPAKRAPWDMYAFMRESPAEQAHMRSVGIVPWWSIDGIRASVFRPLASLTLWLDHRIAPRSHVWCHVHSMLWWTAALVAASRLFSASMSPVVAALATLFLALDPAWVFPLGWIANRCSVMSSFFACLALHAHIRGRRDGARWGLPVEAVAMLGALASGEYGLAVGAFVLAWELVLGPGSLAVRARSLWPFALAAAAYLIPHRVGHYGTNISEVYADPFHDPLEFAAHAMVRWPMLVGEVFGGAPAAFPDYASITPEWMWSPLWEKWSVFDVTPRYRAFSAAVLVIVLVPLAWLGRRGLAPRERATFDWMALGALLGLAPMSAAPVHDRLLVVALVPATGASALIAWGLLEQARAARRVVGRIAFAALALVAFSRQTVIEAVRVDGENQRMVHMAGRSRATFRRSPLAEEGFGGGKFILLGVFDHSTGAFGQLVAGMLGVGMPRSWQVLAITKAPLYLRRNSDRVLELSRLEPSTWLDNDLELFFRSPHMLIPKGTTIQQGELIIRVEDTQRGLPSRITVRFPRRIEASGWTLLQQTPDGLTEQAPPAIGQAVIVPIPRMPEPEPLD